MFVQDLFLMKVWLVVHSDTDVVVNKINEFRGLSPVAGQRRETEPIFSNHQVTHLTSLSFILPISKRKRQLI